MYHGTAKIRMRGIIIIFHQHLNVRIVFRILYSHIVISFKHGESPLKANVTLRNFLRDMSSYLNEKKIILKRNEINSKVKILLIGNFISLRLTAKITNCLEFLEFLIKYFGFFEKIL